MINREAFEFIAETFETPVYVYDQGVFQRQLLTLASLIKWRPLKIMFAVKANPNISVVRAFGKQQLFNETVFGIDAVSPGEVVLAIKAGIPSRHVLFTGNNASRQEITVAKGFGVLPNIDSLDMLEWYCRAYPESCVCVRINPNVGAGHHDHCITGGPDSKFGIWWSEAETARKIADKYNVRVIGVHQHIGSQILDPQKFLTAMDMMLTVAPVFPNLGFVDFGGGFGVPYKPGEKELDIAKLGEAMTQKFDRFCHEYGRQLAMYIEPGRYLTAQAGFLLVKVTSVKRNPDGKVFVGVDSGFNHLDRPARYGAYHHIRNISNVGAPNEKVFVVGNICESGDKFTSEAREIPEPRVGDLLVIENAGAYGFSMASNYNLRPRPSEVMITPAGATKQIRKREKVEDLISEF